MCENKGVLTSRLASSFNVWTDLNEMPQSRSGGALIARASCTSCTLGRRPSTPLMHVEAAENPGEHAHPACLNAPDQSFEMHQ